MRVLDIANFDCDGALPPSLTTKADVQRRLGDEPFRYAIISHRWRMDEVLYEHLSNGAAQQRQGYSKLTGAIRQAQSNNIGYLWLDTCCINKDSSAELSEAINSMYRWYEEAEVCYAYLQDVEPGDDFTSSEWFTRGWTLQELLAPRSCIFFTSKWDVIGTKPALAENISTRTRIPVEVLDRSRPLHTVSLAARMSWAAGRVTERPEDEAYCLMGIFDINMPLLYGEGFKAFKRLQGEMLKSLDDFTLFAWTDPNSASTDTHGLLADRPSVFRNSHDIIAYRDWEGENEIRLTNKGLHITLGVENGRAMLPCTRATQGTGFLSFDIGRLTGNSHRYARMGLSRLRTSFSRGTPTEMCFPEYNTSNDHRWPARRKVYLRLATPGCTNGLREWLPYKILFHDRKPMKLPGPNPQDEANGHGNYILGLSSSTQLSFANWHAGVEMVIMFRSQSTSLRGPSKHLALILGTTYEATPVFDFTTFDEHIAMRQAGFDVENIVQRTYTWQPLGQHFKFAARPIPGRTTLEMGLISSVSLNMEVVYDPDEHDTFAIHVFEDERTTSLRIPSMKMLSSKK